MLSLNETAVLSKFIAGLWANTFINSRSQVSDLGPSCYLNFNATCQQTVKNFTRCRILRHLMDCTVCTSSLKRMLGYYNFEVIIVIDLCQIEKNGRSLAILSKNVTCHFIKLF